jgi:replication factor C large subunit
VDPASWTSKHKPQSLKDVVGNEEARTKFTQWLQSWKTGIPKQRAAFLHGPPGVGKTVTVESSANDFGFELVEKNASDYRTEESIRRFAGLASQYSGFFGKKRIILLDELDGVYGTVDRGAIPAITRIIKDTRVPIVLTANDFWDRRFVAFRDRKQYLILEFKKPPAREVMKHLMKIVQREKIIVEEEALRFIANRNQGDIRAAVNDLQALAQGKVKLTFEDVSWLAHRDRKDLIFSVLRQTVYGKSCETARRSIEAADVDLDMFFEWIYENAPHHFNVASDLSKAMTALASADIYRVRIQRTRNWKLLSYMIDHMTAGVAMAREKSKPSGWIPFRFPQRMRMLSTTRGTRKTTKDIGRKIGRRLHISTAVSQRDVLPYLRIIFEENPRMAAGLSEVFRLSEDEVIFVAGGKRKANPILKTLKERGG